jgi:hypothetical protein
MTLYSKAAEFTANYGLKKPKEEKKDYLTDALGTSLAIAGLSLAAKRKAAEREQRSRPIIINNVPASMPANPNTPAVSKPKRLGLFRKKKIGMAPTNTSRTAQYSVGSKLTAARSCLAEFESTNTPIENFLDWKTKRKIIGTTLRNHGKLQRAGASKKLGQTRDALKRASENYEQIANMAGKRLNQIGTAASLSGKAGMSELAKAASQAVERSKTYMPDRLKKSSRDIGGAKTAFDTVTIAKNVGTGALAAGAVGGALALGSKTRAGGRILQGIRDRIRYANTVRGSENFLRGRSAF